MEDYRRSEYQHICSAVARSGGEQDYNPASPRRLTRRCSQLRKYSRAGSLAGVDKGWRMNYEG